MTIEIEKNIPIPSRSRSAGITGVFRRMEVGDSIFFKDAGVKECASIFANANNAGIKLTTRKIDDGIRIWRIA